MSARPYLIIAEAGDGGLLHVITPEAGESDGMILGRLLNGAGVLALALSAKALHFACIGGEVESRLRDVVECCALLREAVVEVDAALGVRLVERQRADARKAVLS